MSFDSLLIHTCDIQTLTQGAQDDYGIPLQSWATLYSNEPCRFMSTTGREIKIGAEVVISDWKMFIDSSVITIDEQDRVTDLRLRSSGVLMDSSVYEVLLVQPMSNDTDLHHSEVLLRKVA